MFRDYSDPELVYRQFALQGLDRSTIFAREVVTVVGVLSAALIARNER
jgi:hypothetical protein